MKRVAADQDEVTTTLAMVAPSSAPIDSPRLMAGISALARRGIETISELHVFEPRLYTPEDDRARADHLARALLDDQFDGVICARGGHGASRLIPYLPEAALMRATKPFIGFSDITTLHLCLARYSSARLIWGPMPAVSFGPDEPPWVMDLLVRGLQDDWADVDLLEHAEGVEPLVAGEVEAPVTGGTLCLLSSSLGTPWELDCAGKILLLEDHNEDLQRIDRYFVHLRLSGKLEAAVGFILGRTFASGPTAPHPASIEAVIREHILPLGKPALFRVPTGHAEYCLPIPLERRVRLVSDPGRGVGKIVVL